MDLVKTVPRPLGVLLVSALLGLTGCSLTLSLEQCQDSDDCAGVTVCTADGLCVDPEEEENGELTGGPCQQLFGAAEDDEAFRIGVVLQLSGMGAGFGRPMLNAIRLGTTGINGIGGVRGRPIGLVVCDTEGRDSIATAAAQHLVNVENLSAIIGMNSSQVIDIGPTIVTPNDVLLISPSATASTISGLQDSLIWRTAPSDETQALAMEELINYLVEDYFPARGVDEPKITLLVRNLDRWATGLREHLSATLPVEIREGDSSRFTIHNFPNVGAGDPADYTGTAADIAAEAVPPDIVVVLGSADSWTIIDFLETLLDNEPLYLGGDAMRNPDEAANADTALEGRVWGTGPRNVADSGYEPYSIFRLQYLGEFGNPDGLQFVPNAFDALYVLAFAAAAEGFSGSELAEGMTRLSSGQDIDPRATQAQEAFQILADGGTINYRGASGPLNFAANGDPEPLPISLWCLRDGSLPEEGILYEVATGFTSQECPWPAFPPLEEENGD